MEQQLLEYEIWALGRLLRALARCSPVPPYKAQLIMAHVLNAHRIWHDRIKGVEVRTTPWEERSLDDCEKLVNELKEEFAGLLSGLSPQRLTESVSYKNTKGQAFTNTIGDILQHLLMHSAYHRGQVNALIRQAGGEPAIIDYIEYVRSGGA
jgi:uncharacterized damage-inducible protein DinB